MLVRLKAAVSALNGRQIATLAIAFAAAVSLTIGSAYWVNSPSYGVLFSGMDAESAAAEELSQGRLGKRHAFNAPVRDIDAKVGPVITEHPDP